jgi:hypothetical protein
VMQEMPEGWRREERRGGDGSKRASYWADGGVCARGGWEQN